MPSKAELQRRKRNIKRDLARVTDDLARLHAKLEQIDAGIEDRRETRKETDDQERRNELHTAIREKLKLREATKIELARAETRSEKLRKRLGKVKKKISKIGQGKPKIVKLDLSFRSGMAGQGQIVGVTGHYTAGPRDDSDDEALQLWRTYHAAHLNQGWAGLGYQIGFTRQGTIVLLRPFTVVGSHTLNNNTGRIGASVHGTTGDTWAPPQIAAYKWWLENGHTDAFPSSHRTPKRPRDLQLRVHNDFMATACPGSFESGYRNP